MILITTKPSSLVMLFFMKTISLLPKLPLRQLTRSYLSHLIFLLMYLPTCHLLLQRQLSLLPISLSLHQLQSLGDPLGRPRHLHTCVISISNRLYRLIPLNHQNQRWCLPKVPLTPLTHFYLTHVSLTTIVLLPLLFPLHKSQNPFCRPCRILSGVMLCVLRWILLSRLKHGLSLLFHSGRNPLDVNGSTK
jgi:hypothetical protein